MKLKYALLITFLSLIPNLTLAHGGVDDGHPEGLQLMDYVELGGIILASIGLMLYSFDKWRKDKKKKPDQ